MSMSILKRYEPKSIDDFFISKNYKEKIKQYIRVNKGRKPLIIYGNRGVGKTTLAKIVLKELGVMNIIVIDKSNYNSILNIQKYSLLGETGYIVENLDEFTENRQLSIFKQLSNAGVKFVITAIDLYRLNYSIRKQSEVFNLYNPNPIFLKKLVYNILNDYNLKVPKSVVERIVQTHPHDIRALLTDLQVLIHLRDWRLFLKNYNVRNYKYNLFSVLESFFNSTSYVDAVKSYLSFIGDQSELNAHITDNVISSIGALKDKTLALEIIGESVKFKQMGAFNKMKTLSVSFYELMLVPELYRKKKLKIKKLQTSKALFELNKHKTRLYLMNNLISKIKKHLPHYSREEIYELLELYAYTLENGVDIKRKLKREYGLTTEDVENIIKLFGSS